jgi:acyl-CoA thioesterase-2
MTESMSDKATLERVTLSDLLDGLRLIDQGGGRYAAPNIDYYGKNAGRSAASAMIADVIWGGQLLGQSVAAALARHPDSEVHTLHSVFMRGGRVSVPLQLHAETLNDGRSFGTESVRFVQGEREIARSVVLTHRPDADVIRHQPGMPVTSGLDAADSVREDHGAYQLVYAGGYDPRSREIGPAEAAIWLTFPGAPDDSASNQALLSMLTVPFMIGTAMRPHAGLTVGDSHLSVSTAVLSQTVTFHEPVNAGAWLLYHHDGYYSGRGRVHGTGRIFTDHGDLVASFVQDGMVRRISPRTSDSPGASL